MAATPNGFIGTVVSGSGSSYQVAISGLGTVPVTQQQIEASETIPAGTKAYVVKEGQTYKMCVPVWLQG